MLAAPDGPSDSAPYIPRRIYLSTIRTANDVVQFLFVNYLTLFRRVRRTGRPDSVGGSVVPRWAAEWIPVRFLQLVQLTE